MRVLPFPYVAVVALIVAALLNACGTDEPAEADAGAPIDTGDTLGDTAGETGGPSTTGGTTGGASCEGDRDCSDGERCVNGRCGPDNGAGPSDTGAGDGTDSGPADTTAGAADTTAGTGTDGGGGTTETTGTSGTGTTDPTTDADTTTTGPAPVEVPEWVSGARCDTPPPEGVSGTQIPAPFPEYDGECPTLANGYVKIQTSGKEREFLLVVPKDPQPNETFPVLFMWHWLKSSANSFYETGDVQAAVDQQRFIAVIPESLEDIDLFGVASFPWPFLNVLPESRIEEEFTFFDDMLACVAAQFPVNNQCVSTVGVSAGALFSALLAPARAGVLSSFLSLSGGVGSQGVSNSFLLPYAPSMGHKYPALVLWGGPQDSCALVNFESGSKALEKGLTDNGHFMVECIHNCKHAEPPIDAAPGQSRYFTLWEFMLNHPYWLPDGTSPYLLDGQPEGSVDWCSIGAGTAKARTGTCGDPACPI